MEVEEKIVSREIIVGSGNIGGRKREETGMEIFSNKLASDLARNLDGNASSSVN